MQHQYIADAKRPTKEEKVIKIRWLGDTTGLDLKPEWEVSFARIHTVKNMLHGNGKRRDTVVLYLNVNEKQYRRLVDEFGKNNIPSNILGLEVIVLDEPGRPLWIENPPKGYEKSIKVSTYTAMEIVCG